MIATVDLIKDNIYEKVSKINDENVLMAIETIISKMNSENIDSVTQKEDFVGYIKEWVKEL